MAGVLPAPIATAAKLRTSRYDSEALRTALDQVARYQVLTDDMRRRMKTQSARLVGILDRRIRVFCAGTLEHLSAFNLAPPNREREP